MRVHTLDCEMLSPASLEDTFRVFESPYNLARITPPNLGFKILTPNLQMRKGLEIDYEFRWIGLPRRWRTVITHYEPPHLFIDEALKSPYTLWRHRHTFRATERGTVVADHVDYALPLGPLGLAANTLLVARQLKEIFGFRQKALADLLGGPATEIREPVLE